MRRWSIWLTILWAGCFSEHRSPRLGGVNGSNLPVPTVDSGRPQRGDMDAGHDDRPTSRPRDAGSADDGSSAVLDSGLDPVIADADDAVVDAAVDAEIPEPPRVEQAFPYLVIHGSADDGRGAVWSASMHAPSEPRRLDPEPEAIDVGATPLVYSPDGRKLALVRFDEASGKNDYYISYPCREAGCTSAHADRVLTVESSLGVRFAPDGSGVLITGGREMYYAATGPSSASPALQIPVQGANGYVPYFVGGGRALVIEDTVPYLVDLRTPQSAARAPLPILPVLPPELAAGRIAGGMVSPDGAHVVFQQRDLAGTYQAFVYAVDDLLAGELTPRKPPAGAQPLYASDDRLVMFADGASWAERWDGSDPVSLPITLAGVHGCGNHVLYAGALTDMLYPLMELTLPGAGAPAAEPQATKLLDAQTGLLRFTPDCARLAIAKSDCSQLTIADLTTHQVFTKNRGCGISVAPNAEIYGATPFGVKSLLRVSDTAVDEEWTARVPFNDARPRYAGQRSALYLGAELMAAGDPGLYEIDLTTADHPVEHRLRPERLSAAPGPISPDDRYLAYSVRHAAIADPPDVESGLFELDLQTGKSQRLGPALSQKLAGALRMTAIPGRSAVLIAGQYRADEVTRAYACDLQHAHDCVAQLPDEAANWQVLATTPQGPGTAINPVAAAFSRDGKRVALSVATPNGPGLVAVPVRLSDADPPAELLAEAYEPSFNGEHVMTQRFAPLSFNDDLGVIWWQPLDANGDWHLSRDLYATELQGGTSRTLGEPENGWPAATGDELPGALAFFDAQGGRHTVIGRSSSGTAEVHSLSVVDADSGDRGVTIAQSDQEIIVSRVPDSELLLYGIAGDDGFCEQHVYDLATRSDTQIAWPSDPALHGVLCGPYEISADRSTALFMSLDADLVRVELHAPFAGQVLHGRTWGAPGTDLSRDGRRVLVTVGASAALFDADQPEQLVPLQLPEGPAGTALLTPDGRFAIARAVDSSTTQTTPWYRIDLAHPDVGIVPIALPPEEYWPTFDPSGQYLAFLASPTEVRVVRLDQPDAAVRVIVAGPAAGQSEPTFTWVE